MFEVDCRGLACPIPVVRFQKAIAAHPAEVILIKVDSENARDNVSRVAGDKGYTVKITRQGDEYHLQATPKTK